MANGEDCIYISLGSEVEWQKWQADAFVKGLLILNNKLQGDNRGGVRCIVSFRPKEDKMFDWPEKNDEKWWVSNWTPQIELLSHENLKAGLHHCGLGGTLEFINNEIPALTMPHFGDQGMNARNIIKNGAGLPLYDTTIGDKDADESNMALKDPVFTAETFAS